MRKRNHRLPVSLNEIKALRVRVSAAYKNHTGNEFLKGYKEGFHITKLASIIEDSECGKISCPTLYKFFDHEKDHLITEINFSESTINILKCFADKFPSIAENKVSFESADQNAIFEISKQLQHLYEQDQILEGVEKANLAYDTYKTHPKILRHVFRFNMRVKNWPKINAVIEELSKKELSDKVVALCNLALFESELRKAYSNYRFDRSEQSTKIIEAKRYLEKIPQSQHNNKEYWYWLGRWYLELWLSTEGTDIVDLKLSLSCFEKSLQLKYSWFCHCYKCIILMLLGNKTTKEEIKKFTEIIIEEKKRQPKRPAVRTYMITALILNDDISGLKNFLLEQNLPVSVTDFQSTIFHHIELIFFRNKKKQITYKNILERWIANLP